MLGYERRRIEKTNAEMMSGYGEKKRVVGRSVGKLLKIFPNRFAWMMMCIIMAIPSCSSRKISEQDSFDKHLGSRLTGRSEQSPGRAIDIDGGTHLVS